MGVESTETARLGWARDTYTDVYAPSLPKKAILGCHGYKEQEAYAPTRCQIPVPPPFLARMCPMAEDIVDSVRGAANLVGTTNHWTMVIGLRPHLFLCAAALYQVAPSSPIFRLPALAHDDVRLWMTTEFPTQLTALEAAAGNPIGLERLQNTLLQQSLQHVVSVLQQQSSNMTALRAFIDRRTAALSPPKRHIEKARPSNNHGIRSTDSTSAIARHAVALQFGHEPLEGLVPISTTSTLSEAFHLTTVPSAEVDEQVQQLLDSDVFVDANTRARQDTGVYEMEDNSLRAFVAPSPASPVLGRPRTQVDLILPPAQAFTQPGDPLSLPHFGTGSVTWDQVFAAVQRGQESFLWSVWQPARSLESSTVAELWEWYNTGEVVRDKDGIPIGMKPPLRLVEQRFLAAWRPGNARKTWQRFREIPEWIEKAVREQHITPDDAIAQLEAKRHPDGTRTPKGINALVSQLADERKELALRAGPALQSSSGVNMGIPAAGAGDSEAGKRKRAPAVAARTRKRQRHAPATSQANT
ncbi:hypothetical protein OH77DRAFT_1592366 [Trametes cingulata]|nr:hypothetical protein OH77DRAFT_1592366 [Trametes cingulata]